MLDPDLVLDAVLAAFRSIDQLIAALDGDPANVVGHTYLYGVEDSLSRSLYAMRSPSVLVVYLDLLGGNFDGATIWKHRFEVYIRPANAAPFADIPALVPSPMHLWWLMMHEPVLGTARNIRQTAVLPELMLPDTPTLVHHQDENLADLFVGSLVFPELGDD